MPLAELEQLKTEVKRLQWVRTNHLVHKGTLNHIADTAQKMKFSITDFFRKCDQIRRKLENFIFCAVRMAKSLSNRLGTKWFWVRMLLEKHKIGDNMLFWVRSSLKCSQAQSGDSINTYIWHEKIKQSKRNKTFINLAILS